MSSVTPKDPVSCDLDNLRFETGGLENLDAVMLVMERSFSAHLWRILECQPVQIHAFSMPGTQLILARSQDKLCGFAICRNVLDEQELLMIAVDPKFRKLGIASRLLEEIAIRAQQENMEVIFLEVRSNNPAKSLYRRHGF